MLLQFLDYSVMCIGCRFIFYVFVASKGVCKLTVAHVHLPVLAEVSIDIVSNLRVLL